MIVGMSRAGTTWMAKCLNEHPVAAVFGETLFWGRGYIEPSADGTYDGAQLSQVLNRLKSGGVSAMVGDGPGALKKVNKQNWPAVIDRVLSSEHAPLTPAQVFLRTAEALAEAEGKQVGIEKTPHHLNWIGRILKALPDARFVVMIRDPYSFMLSYKHQGDRKVEHTRKAFERLYHPLLCALIWRGYMRSTRAALDQYPRQILLIKTQQIKRSPQEVLDQVQRFLELPVVPLAEAVPPDNTSFPAGERPSLQAEDLFWMNRLNRKLIQQGGFAVQATPARPLRIIKSVLVLPFWSFSMLLDLRSKVPGSLFGYIRRWLFPRG